MQRFDLQSLRPSRRRSFAFVHTLLHLLFRLLVVFLLGRLDGLSRPALRREGTFEHRGIHSVCSARKTTKCRREPERSEGSDTSWSKRMNNRRCRSHEHVRGQSLEAFVRHSLPVSSRDGIEQVSNDGLAFESLVKDSRCGFVDSGRREEENGRGTGSRHYLRHGVR